MFQAARYGTHIRGAAGDERAAPWPSMTEATISICLASQLRILIVGNWALFGYIANAEWKVVCPAAPLGPSHPYPGCIREKLDIRHGLLLDALPHLSP